MTLIVHTAPMSYRGPDALPVTRRVVVDPVGSLFAPSNALLDSGLAARRAGEGEEDWPRYRAAYVAEMRRSYREQRAAWDALLARESVTLLCFCQDATRCHRRVLAEILAACGADDQGERVVPQLDLFTI